MPNPVNGASPASAIAALLRQAMAGQAQPMRQRGGAAAASGKAGRANGKGASAASGRRPNQAPLSELIVARARSLNPDADEYRSRLLRLVIEASLLHEFGSGLVNAPKFQAMVDQVLHELESAPQLKHDVDVTLKGLVGPAYRA